MHVTSEVRMVVRTKFSMAAHARLSAFPVLVGDNGCCALGVAIAAASSRDSIGRLTSLDLDSNKIGASGIAALATALGKEGARRLY